MTVERCFETKLLRYLSNPAILIPLIGKYISYEGQIFFQNVQICMYISEMEENISKIVFCLLDTCIWMDRYKFSLLQRESS